MTANVLAIAAKPSEIHPIPLKAVQSLRRSNANQDQDLQQKQALANHAKKATELYFILQSLETIADAAQKDVNDKFPNSLLANIFTHYASLFTSKSSQFRTKLTNTAKNVALNSEDQQSVVIAAYLMYRIDQDWIKKTYEEMRAKTGYPYKPDPPLPPINIPDAEPHLYPVSYKEQNQEESQKWRKKIFAFFASMPKASKRIVPTSIDELAISTASVIFSHLAKGDAPYQALMRGVETFRSDLSRLITETINRLFPDHSLQKYHPNIPRPIFFSPENSIVQDADRVIIASNQEVIRTQPSLAM